MEVGGYEYRMLYRWIEQGMPYGSDSDPAVVSIECQPAGRVMQRGSQQQITVLAHYSNGATEDVTRMALFEPNDAEMAEAGSTGLVKTLDLAGESPSWPATRARSPLFRATVPLGARIERLPEEKSFIDRAVFAKLKALGHSPVAACDDATFLRRGRSTSPDRRRRPAMSPRSCSTRTRPSARLVDRLLDSPAYADYFANKWNLVLRNKRRNPLDTAATYAFYHGFANSLYDNKPYDHFVREILTASGDPRPCRRSFGIAK